LQFGTPFSAAQKRDEALLLTTVATQVPPLAIIAPLPFFTQPLPQVIGPGPVLMVKLT